MLVCGQCTLLLMGRSIRASCWVTCLSRWHVGRIQKHISPLVQSAEIERGKMQMNTICIQCSVIPAVQIYSDNMTSDLVGWNVGWRGTNWCTGGWKLVVVFPTKVQNFLSFSGSYKLPSACVFLLRCRLAKTVVLLPPWLFYSVFRVKTLVNSCIFLTGFCRCVQHNCWFTALLSVQWNSTAKINKYMTANG